MSAAQAPGSLELVRSFLNSEAPGGAGIGAWCRESGLGDVTGEEELARLRSFAGALRDALEPAAGIPAAPGAWRELQRFSQYVCYEMHIGEGGVLRLAPRGAENGGRAVGAILALVYDAVRCGAWRRMKACANPACRRAFYDRSKNRSGTWCDMAACGNRIKARRRRAKKKEPLG